RLIDHCQKTGQEKRKAFREESYWAKPVPGWGDPKARLVIIGLAPAAHGANRTGRIFTGDRSGEWLYRALYRAGFASQPESLHRGDGLKLIDTYITSVVKCAPPGNRPTRTELEACRSRFLVKELENLREARVYLALGQIAWDGLWTLLKGRPKFKHGFSLLLPNGRLALASYHPSQQNTFTGVLTERMFDEVFSKARSFIHQIK